MTPAQKLTPLTNKKAAAKRNVFPWSRKKVKKKRTTASDD